MEDIRTKISSLQQSVQYVRAAQTLIGDAGVTVIPEICTELLSLIECELTKLQREHIYSKYLNGATK